MKTIQSIFTASVIAFSINTIVIAQNNPLHGLLPMDSITAINLPSGILLAGQTDELPPSSNNLIVANNGSQGITLNGEIDNKPIIKPHFEQPGLAIQKNNYYNIRILPVITSDYISIQNAEINSIMELYELSGRPIMKRMISNGDFKANLPELPKGVYIVVVRSKSQSVSQKFTIR
jgi:hypothetical protein